MPYFTLFEQNHALAVKERVDWLHNKMKKAEEGFKVKMEDGHEG